MCGTLKFAILDNDALCKDFVERSLYDSKPFYFFSSSFPDIKWMQRDQESWHPGIKKIIKVPF